MNYRIREESFRWGTAFYPERWSEEYQEWVATTGGAYADLKTAQEAIELYDKNKQVFDSKSRIVYDYRINEDIEIVNEFSEGGYTSCGACNGYGCDRCMPHVYEED